MKRLLLQDAVILGDTLKKCNSSAWLSSDGSCGCALGGALLAAGVSAQAFTEQQARMPARKDWNDYAEIECIHSLWPWLTGDHVKAISNIYFEVEEGDATIEDVAAYVRSVEPIPAPQFPEVSTDSNSWRDAEGLTDERPEIAIHRGRL